MKLKLILLTAAIALSTATFTGCSTEDGTPADGTSATTTSTTTTTKNDLPTSKSEEQQTTTETEVTEEPIVEEYPDIWDVLPYIDETPAEDFKYEFTLDYGVGMEITGYKGKSTQIRIPDTIEGEPVVSVSSLGSGVTELILPDTVQQLSVDKKKLEYINIPKNLPTEDIFLMIIKVLKNYPQFIYQRV